MSKSLGNFIGLRRGDGQARRRDHPPVVRVDRLLGRPGDRRQDPRPRRRRLPPHPQHAALPARQHQRLRRRRATPCPSARCSRSTAGRWPATAELQAEIVGNLDAERGVFAGGHYGVYEFHPVVAKLQVFCSRGPGRLLPRRAEGPALHHAGRLARRAARRRRRSGTSPTPCCAGWRRSSASPPRRRGRCSGPAGSFSIFAETYCDTRTWEDPALLAKWRRIGEVRAESNRQIELLRAAGKLGSSLQAEATIARRCRDLAAARQSRRRPALRAHHLGGDGCGRWRPARATDTLVAPTVSTAPKCERCWHYRGDVGADPAHPTICGRCIANLLGAGEQRTVA